MDDSTRQVALIDEVTEGQTPANPTWIQTRNARIDGGLQTSRGESDERQANAMLVSTWRMNNSLSKTLDLRLNYDTGLQNLIKSVLNSPWTTNVAKFGTAKQSFSIEEKWIDDGGGLIFRRSTGCVVDSMTFSIRNNDMSRVTANIIGLDETTATTAISGATYTAPGAGNVMVPADAVVNDMIGLISPVMISGDITLSTNARGRYGWGSPKASKTNRGALRVSARFVMYFDTVGQYTALKAMPTGDVDFTMGDVTGQKYRILIPNARASNVSIPDGGNNTDSTLAFDVVGEYDAVEQTSFKITRAVS